MGSIEAFANAIRNARQILDLAENAGEIVFDRDLLAQLPLGRCTFAVRGSPVLEDGSPEFREQFRAADLVIAKRQGNFESLAGADKTIFFLLKIKCEVLSRHLGWPRGSLVLHRSRNSAAAPAVPVL